MSSDKLADDKTYCEIIAKSIADIIRFSLDEEFRRKSCELFGVFSTKDTEKEISRRLMSILQNQRTGSKKRGKKSSKQESTDGVQEESDTVTQLRTEEASNTDCSSETFSQNSSQKNWLQISSERYRDAVKRKRSQFCSQPQSAGAIEKDFEFLNSKLRFSSSQPISDGPSCSRMNEVMDTSCEFSDDWENFCKKKFRESFELSHGKYLRANLKYQKRLGFQ